MKVLVWNIEKFTDAKFRDGYAERGGELSRKRKVEFWAAEIAAYMRQAFTGNGHAAWRPDVVAILEVLAPSDAALGQPLPINTPGADGLLELLGYIKAWTRNRSWRLVPPLKCNPAKPAGEPWAQSEVVGVFYDSRTVRFDGPNQWVAGASQPPGLVATEPYPPPWNRPTVTLNTRYAGMVDFYAADGTQLLFPGAGNRRPFVVDLSERAAPFRTIRFGFVHTSPGFHQEGTQEFAAITQMKGDGGFDPAITVFAGDFNVNDYNADVRRDSYAPLKAARFVKAFSRAGQRSTHYRQLRDARPHNWNDYQGEMLIDNFLVRHRAGGGAAVVAGYPKAAVNCVAGWPAPYATTMNLTIANLLTYDNTVEAFRWWENFWHIRKCSDHVPTFLNIT